MQGRQPQRQDSGREPAELALARMLGLDPDFASDVAARGQEAIIDAVQGMDQTGAHTRLMALVQRVAIYMEERVIAGDPPDEDELLDAVGDSADSLRIDRGQAVELVGPVLEVYQRAARVLARGGGNELGPNAGNGTAARPGDVGSPNAPVRE